MPRAKTNIEEIQADLMKALDAIRKQVSAATKDEEFATLETFCAIALRVMKKTNPSKIRSEAMTVEVQCRMPPG